MKKSTSLVNLYAIAALLFSLQGCALMSDRLKPADIDPSEVYDTVVEHTILPGDRLVDISTRYTGDVNQWSAIAAFNNITNPRSLRIGDIVAIPYSLIPEELKTTELHLATRKPEIDSTSVDVASNSSAASTASVSATGSLALKRESAVPANEVVVEPVVINRTFELNPIDKTVLSEPSNTEAPTVRVVGTYYPKGVYQQPASYSTLMMRVAPGTVFELEREVNNWYKVITANGVGYLRAVDGIVVLPD